MVEETGSTYAENASLKAVAYAQASKILTLADDSGLEVDVLGGLPGINSARYSPLPKATDSDRRFHLLSQLGKHQRPWLAKFHCTIAIAQPDGFIYHTTGECHGEIIPEERGKDGFGYDPIFLIPDLDRTMAELTELTSELRHHGIPCASLTVTNSRCAHGKKQVTQFPRGNASVTGGKSRSSISDTSSFARSASARHVGDGWRTGPRRLV